MLHYLTVSKTSKPKFKGFSPSLWKPSLLRLTFPKHLDTVYSVLVVNYSAVIWFPVIYLCLVGCNQVEWRSLLAGEVSKWPLGKIEFHLQQWRHYKQFAYIVAYGDHGVRNSSKVSFCVWSVHFMLCFGVRSSCCLWTTTILGQIMTSPSTWSQKILHSADSRQCSLELF